MYNICITKWDYTVNKLLLSLKVLCSKDLPMFPREGTLIGLGREGKCIYQTLAAYQTLC